MPLSKERLYWAGRATLVSTEKAIPLYDELFESYFHDEQLDDVMSGLMRWLAETTEPPPTGEAEVPDPGRAERMTETVSEGEETEGQAAVALIASGAEVLRTKTFAALSELERAEADRLIRRLAVAVPRRRARRMRSVPKGRHFDLRRTLRTSMRTGGDPFRRAWRDRIVRRRPLVLLLDISGSMSAYSRALMQFGYAVMRAGSRVEVFCFGTRLTRLSRALRRRDPDAALDEVTSLVSDWEGGTRIGESLKQLLDRYSETASVRSSVVVLCSDGLERGDPEVLAEQMARLSRLAHKVIWVNPLKGDPRYEPLARGMAAALPHVDIFLSGHNIASLEALAVAVGS